MLLFRKRPKVISVYCDGAIGDERRAAGVGVVIRDEQNEIIGLVKRGLPPMTNNEAEYAALTLALEAVKPLQPQALKIYMDSEVVVGQMRGRFTVNSAALKRWHTRPVNWPGVSARLATSISRARSTAWPTPWRMRRWWRKRGGEDARRMGSKGASRKEPGSKQFSGSRRRVAG